LSSLSIPGYSAIYRIRSALSPSSKSSPVLSNAMRPQSADVKKHGLRSYIAVMIYKNNQRINSMKSLTDNYGWKEMSCMA
jgi:hypothetical protein